MPVIRAIARATANRLGPRLIGERHGIRDARMTNLENLVVDRHPTVSGKSWNCRKADARMYSLSAFKYLKDGYHLYPKRGTTYYVGNTRAAYTFLNGVSEVMADLEHFVTKVSLFMPEQSKAISDILYDIQRVSRPDTTTPSKQYLSCWKRIFVMQRKAKVRKRTSQ